MTRPAGSIDRNELLTAEELRRRLRWGLRTWRHALRQGLRAVRFGRQQYVRGDDVLDFFGRLGGEEGQQ